MKSQAETTLFKCTGTHKGSPCKIQSTSDEMYSKDSWGRLRRKFDRAPTPQEIIDNVICAECAGRINKAQKRKQKPVISFTLLSKILNRARKAKKKLRAQKNKRRRMDKKREVDESKAA